MKFTKHYKENNVDEYQSICKYCCLQLELKAKVEEYKKQKEEEEAFFKEQDELREQEETDRKRQLSAREISRFRQRVGL